MLHPKALCQLEFHTNHIESTLAFFEAVFDWKVVPITLHEYVVLEVPSDSPFGISVVATQSKGRQAVIPYFRWDGSIETLLEKTAAQGGRLVWGPRFVPAYGNLYLIEEPGGIKMGFFRESPEKIP